MLLNKVSLLILVLTLSNGNIIRKPEKTPFQLEEILLRNFTNNGWNGTWLSGNVLLYQNEDLDYLTYDARDKTSQLFVSASVLDNFAGGTVEFSKDQSLMLIRYNVTAVFRHSTTAQYAILDLNEQKYYDIHGKQALQLATFAPIGHGLAYVFENNIYYISNVTEIETPRQVTNTGIPGIIYNGVPDWVYEEEVLGGGSALWFSPDGQELAFATFNDMEVKEFTYIIYGAPGSLEDQYPHEAKIRYPKVGTPNPIVRTYIYSLDGSHDTAELAEGSSNENNDFVLLNIEWVNEKEIALLTSNRVQNKGTLFMCTKEGICTKEASYEEEGGWVEPHLPVYNAAASKRVEILAQPEGNERYDHLVLTDNQVGESKRLTHGNRMVTNIYGWDEKNDVIYYASTVEDTPSQQQVYSVTLEGVDKCLSCGLKDTLAEVCQHASASFSEDYTYVALTCNGPGPAFIEIRNLNKPEDIVVWESSQDLVAKLSEKIMPVAQELKVPINDKYDARVRMLLPQNLDVSKKYPAIVRVYGGPNTPIITTAYSADIQNYFVTNREYIHINIDGRGAGKDGNNKLFEVYRKLGTVEIEDQINVTRYLQRMFPFIDESNTGIWGWSYGGFATAWVLAQDKDSVFKCGLSVAPVTSFIYYDTIYTERYMGLPTSEDNEAGYNKTDVTRNVESLRGKRFFLVHGNGDDNVHYQQSMLLAKALELADIQFRQQSYPDEVHSLSNVRPHLYHTMDAFFADCFGVPAIPKSANKHKISK